MIGSSQITSISYHGNNQFVGKGDTQTINTLGGFDVEAGMTIPKFDCVDVFVGYYHFPKKDLPTIAGPRIRTNIKLNNFLHFEGEIQYDKQRKLNYFVGGRLVVPIGGNKENHLNTLSKLQQKMTQMPVRDVDVISVASYDDSENIRPSDTFEVECDYLLYEGIFIVEEIQSIKQEMTSLVNATAILMDRTQDGDEYELMNKLHCILLSTISEINEASLLLDFRYNQLNIHHKSNVIEKLRGDIVGLKKIGKDVSLAIETYKKLYKNGKFKTTLRKAFHSVQLRASNKDILIGPKRELKTTKDIHDRIVRDRPLAVCVETLYPEQFGDEWTYEGNQEYFIDLIRAKKRCVLLSNFVQQKSNDHFKIGEFQVNESDISKRQLSVVMDELFWLSDNGYSFTWRSDKSVTCTPPNTPTQHIVVKDYRVPQSVTTNYQMMGFIKERRAKYNELNYTRVRTNTLRVNNRILQEYRPSDRVNRV